MSKKRTHKPGKAATGANRQLKGILGATRSNSRKLEALAERQSHFEETLVALLKKADNLLDQAGDRRDEIKREIRALRDVIVPRHDGGLGRIGSGTEAVLSSGATPLRRQR